MKKPSVAKKTEPKKKDKNTATAGSNTIDPEKRAIFLSDKDRYAKAIERQKKTTADVRNAAKAIKADGFTLRQVKLAIQLESPEGEAEFRSLIANDLLAAQYAGAQIGSQLQLFLEDKDRTPSADMAADEGTRDAMQNKPAKPGYDPSTPQHASYMAAYGDEQGRQVKGGIKPLNTEMN